MKAAVAAQQIVARVECKKELILTTDMQILIGNESVMTMPARDPLSVKKKSINRSRLLSLAIKIERTVHVPAAAKLRLKVHTNTYSRIFFF